MASSQGSFLGGKFSASSIAGLPNKEPATGPPDYNALFATLRLPLMPFEVTPLVPVVGTVAAALVAGGIARANLIASKETKISEFRQAWINALRDDLAALFSNVRTLTRALQESRAPVGSVNNDFGIEKAKITAVRHGAAETHHRIRLRLNAGQTDHQKLLRLLKEMMDAQQHYLQNHGAIVDNPIEAVEAAALYAAGVLKSEWTTVKVGEEAYRDAIQTTKYTLRTSFAILALLVLGYPIYYWTASYLEAKAAKPAPAVAVVAPAAVPAPAPPPATAPQPAAAVK